MKSKEDAWMLELTKSPPSANNTRISPFVEFLFENKTDGDFVKLTRPFTH